ncbi:MAG: DMT family transporter [Rhodospirillaceae bacterium]|jgi:drug/metabolite transporter (DMT)-like permease|nr:DMT family transporter [Rhodospirillaceae bacterium]MBT3494258.1 DMT family transporter [Rhodospirillaceae bacterium]MBT3778662.1 DMT family transporter [Rhodospirillaceae bacterium]MBT3979201.1 DMT family transporter [Rhodospirillaceae bacterium]MBT4170732.1 DMT family transporter [Rhodospirillaceae bacterium]
MSRVIISPTWRDNFVGLLLVLLGGLFITTLTWIVRSVADDVHPLQAAFMRYGFGTLLLLPLVVRFEKTDFDPKLLGGHFLRGIVHAISVLLWFYAVTLMTLADLTALSFTAPVFVTIGAFLFLGERFSYRRLAGIIIAFLGAVVILRPGIEIISLGAIAILISSPFQAVSTLMAKHLARHTSIYAMVFYLSLFVTMISSIPTLFVWNNPSLHTIGLTFGAGVMATAAHFCWSRSFQIAELSFTQPGFYFTLIWAVAIGYFAYDEWPDIWSGLGAAIIIGATAYIAARERRAAGPVRVAPRIEGEQR